MAAVEAPLEASEVAQEVEEAALEPRLIPLPEQRPHPLLLSSESSQREPDLELKPLCDVKQTNTPITITQL